MTQEQMKNEIFYRMALAFLDRLLAEGLITEEEHKETDRLNAARFGLPEYAAGFYLSFTF